MTREVTETIAAIATPSGRGGVGIVRISGPRTLTIAKELVACDLQPRYATYSSFMDEDKSPIDQGIVLYFKAPASFTGEDVLELHGHGGPVVMDQLLQRVLLLGARLARPGEFSERAFLNNKIDLVQAEAIADLIDSETRAAARLANRSLQGDFSKRLKALADELGYLRVYIEAAIDFPEEEIDFLSDGKVSQNIDDLIMHTEYIINGAKVGRLLRDGMTLVITGLPNAGKSSLLNALSESDTAIVTDIPGTTRDILRERIQIEGMPIHLVDTAGLRNTSDVIEQEGVRRAQEELSSADLILWIYDASENPDNEGLEDANLPTEIPVTYVRNKIDINNEEPGIIDVSGNTEIAVSVKSGDGLDILRQHLKHHMGFDHVGEGDFMARRRHLDALDRAYQHILNSKEVLIKLNAGELAAEELRLAQVDLGEITGEVTADDLLGQIFTSFCIGK